MLIDNEIIIKVLESMILKINNSYEHLDKLDLEVGDGEHGTNLNRGFSILKNKLKELKKLEPGNILLKTGEILVFNIGGAAGPLYGTAFIEAGKAIQNKNNLSEEEIIEIFNLVLIAIKKRGGAKPGDKTMIDTLEPAINTLKVNYLANKDWGKALLAMKESAKNGMNSTKDMSASKGRSSYLGERSKGTIDPGATSMYLLLEIIIENIIKEY